MVFHIEVGADALGYVSCGAVVFLVAAVVNRPPARNEKVIAQLLIFFCDLSPRAAFDILLADLRLSVTARIGAFNDRRPSKQGYIISADGALLGTVDFTGKAYVLHALSPIVSAMSRSMSAMTARRLSAGTVSNESALTASQAAPMMCPGGSIAHTWSTKF